MSIRDLLIGTATSMTPAEERIAQVLLSDYPTAGLGTAASIAKRAGVSDPTVSRLCTKLGFENFQVFQNNLLSEVEARLRSPLSMMASHDPGGTESPAISYMRSVQSSLAAAETSTPAKAYERAVRLIMEGRQIWLLGGRFSGLIAGMLAGHLDQFRSGVTWLREPALQHFDRLVDFGKRDVLVVFDYRRYQTDVVSFARQAADTGARLIVFTDGWQSPAAAHANVILVAPVEVHSPYDTMTPALAQVEALVAQILAEHGPEVQNRIKRIEKIRTSNHATETKSN